MTESSVKLGRIEKAVLASMIWDRLRTEKIQHGGITMVQIFDQLMKGKTLPNAIVLPDKIYYLIDPVDVAICSEKK